LRETFNIAEIKIPITNIIKATPIIAAPNFSRLSGKKSIRSISSIINKTPSIAIETPTQIEVLVAIFYNLFWLNPSISYLFF